MRMYQSAPISSSSRKVLKFLSLPQHRFRMALRPRHMSWNSHLNGKDHRFSMVLLQSTGLGLYNQGSTVDTHSRTVKAAVAQILAQYRFDLLRSRSTGIVKMSFRASAGARSGCRTPEGDAWRQSAQPPLQFTLISFMDLHFGQQPDVCPSTLSYVRVSRSNKYPMERS